MEPTIIVDSCILVKWFIPEEYSECAVILRDDYLNGLINVVVPKYALLEFCNALRKYVYMGIMSRDDLNKALQLLKDTEIKYIDINMAYILKTIDYSLENSITIYDAYYIILAHEYNGTMYTADEKLLKKLKNREYRVKHIQEYVKDRDKWL